MPQHRSIKRQLTAKTRRAKQRRKGKQRLIHLLLLQLPIHRFPPGQRQAARERGKEKCSSSSLQAMAFPKGQRVKSSNKLEQVEEEEGQKEKQRAPSRSPTASPSRHLTHSSPNREARPPQNLLRTGQEQREAEAGGQIVAGVLPSDVRLERAGNHRRSKTGNVAVFARTCSRIWTQQILEFRRIICV